jgi:putative oxygen-independent coproporphyrinogen III oxidase
MPIFTDLPPLALYVHIPWCVQKCPYCDFNSHAMKDRLPEELYVHALLQELAQHADTLKHRPLVSIFFGGGTPSLFSGNAIARILEGVAKHLSLPSQTEITLEANPGTVDQAHFQDYRAAGVNRLSIGVQSLQNEKLKTLGRIHDRAYAFKAVEIAKQSGFDNFNLDIMYGLPAQSMEEALQDLHDALACEPTHFSWYQLTIEPNTLFYHQRPTLPPDESIWDMQLAGQAYLNQKGYQQYEVSAYAKPNKRCAHNLNYWEFGDYLGIGAGAHSKLTDASGRVTRFAQVRHPKDYLDAAKRNHLDIKTVSEHDLTFEFMLNALRLTDGVAASLFTERTGLPLLRIMPTILAAQDKGLLEKNNDVIRPTEFGRKFLNDLVEMFL